MKTLKYAWRVVVNLITLFIVISIFNIASSGFETTVFAILVLIYLSINTFASSWAIHQIEFSEALNSEFKSIKDLINLKNNDNTEINKRILDDITYDLPIKTPEEYKIEIENDEKEIRKERAENKKNIMVKFYINLGFQLIIYVFSLYKLISVFN